MGGGGAGISERGLDDSDLGLGWEWNSQEPTWTQQAPQPRSPLLRVGGFEKAAELQTLGLLRRQVRGEEAPGPCFGSPWQRGLECHSRSPLPRHIRTPSSAASSQCTKQGRNPGGK